jgi:prevent-host-death family protein
MKIVSLAEVKARFSYYIAACAKSPVIVTKNGKPVAFIAPIEDEADLDSIFLAYNTRLRKLLEAADERISKTGGIPHDEFWKQVEESASSSDSRRKAA